MREYVKNYVKDKFLHYRFDDYEIIEEDGSDILIVDIGYQYIPQRQRIFVSISELECLKPEFREAHLDNLFKGVDGNIEPTVNRRKYSEDVFFEALESWYKKLKEEVEKTTELNETTIKTPVNVMSDTSIIAYYDLKEYGSDNRTRFNINGDMNYEFDKEV